MNQQRFDAIVAVLDDSTDAEKVDAELRAVRAEDDARVAVSHADAERSRAEGAAARACPGNRTLQRPRPPKRFLLPTLRPRSS